MQKTHKKQQQKIFETMFSRRKLQHKAAKKVKLEPEVALAIANLDRRKLEIQAMLDKQERDDND